jgi:hypothetical protein
MRSLSKAFILGSFLATAALAEDADQQAEVLVNPGGQNFLTWEGRHGRTYFLQASHPAAPLESWQWAPVTEGGNGQTISYEVGGTADRAFFRLLYTDETPPPGVSLEDWDIDGDGLSNLEEITLHGTNPLRC